MAAKIAIVTGAGSGIGRAAALRLAQNGFSIALIGRTESTLHAVANEIRTLNAEPLVIAADVSKNDQVESMIRRVAERFHRIDLLVNNAGMAPSVPLADLSPALWHDILDANLSSAFYATRAIWPIMQKQYAADKTGGAIVNISSMAAKDPFPGLGAYAIAKIGVNMLSLVSAREGDPFNIRVVAIAPAAVDTPMFRNLVGDQSIDPAQILHPDDVAAAILDVAQGSLRYASGDTIYLHRRPT